MCTAGVTQLAATVNWSMAQDQNVAMGSPLSTANLFPIYGAVGSSSTAPTSGDTQLGAETARVVVSEATSSGGVIILMFFYGTTGVGWTITEAGVFVSSGASVAGSGANTGLLLDHATFTAVTKTTAQTATLGLTFDF